MNCFSTHVKKKEKLRNKSHTVTSFIIEITLNSLSVPEIFMATLLNTLLNTLSKDR